MQSRVKIDKSKAGAELAKRYQHSFFGFVQFFWDTIIAEEPVWNWHIKYLCERLQLVAQGVAERKPKDFDYLIINIPPGSSKSTVISEMYPLWCWTIDPTQRFICGSYASTPAEDIADKCHKIYTSDKFKALYPHLVKNTAGGKTNFRNGLRGERYTTSTGSGITGIHAHQIILDDPMNPAIAASDLERERANRWVSETIGSRKVSKEVSVTIIVMQRLHEMDTTGYLLAKDGLRIEHICLPAEISDRVSPAHLAENYQEGLFDPIRASRPVLESIKADLGSSAYAGQFEQAPTTPGGNIIKEAWFEYAPPSTLEHLRNPLKDHIQFFADTAFTDKSKNDPTGLLGACYIGSKLYITIAKKVSMKFPDLIRFIPEWAVANGYTNSSMIRIEPKANGLSVIDQLRVGSKLNVTSTPTPTDSKETRLNAVSPLIESGRVVLIHGSWNEEFVNEVCGFPNKPHDEYVDLICYAINHFIKRTGGKRLSDYL